MWLLVLKIVLLLCSLLGNITLLQRFTNIPPAFSPLLTLCGIGLLLHLGLIFNCLTIVTFLLYGIGLAGFGHQLFLYFKTKQLHELRSFPLLIFILIFGCCFIIFGNHYFSAWDEFSFWGIALKELLISDQVYGLQFTDFPEYPRFTVVLQYFFVSVTSHQLHEGIAIASHVVFTLSFLPLLSFRKKKNYGILFLTFILLFLSFYVLCMPIHYILVDTVMAILLGSSLAIYFMTTEKKRALLLAVIPLAALTLVKPTGILFSCIGIGIMGIHYVYISNFRNRFWQTSKPLLIFVIIIFSFFGSWKLFLATANTQPSSKSTSQLTITNILHPPKQYEPIKISFINAFFFGDQAVGSAALKPSTLQKDLQRYTGIHISFLQNKKPVNMSAFVVVLFLVVVILLFRKQLHSYFQKKYSLALVTMAMLLAIFAYAIILLLLYVFVFYETLPAEGLQLASYYRYMGSVLLAFFIMLTILVYNTQKKYVIYTIFMMILFLLLVPRSFFGSFSNNKSSVAVKNRENIGTQLQSYLQQNKVSNIAYINFDKNEDITQYYVKYEAFPVAMNSEPFIFEDFTQNSQSELVKQQLEEYSVLIFKEKHQSVMQAYFEKHNFPQQIVVLKSNP